MQVPHVDKSLLQQSIYYASIPNMKDKQIRVSPKIHKQLKMLAAKKGITIKEVVEMAIKLLK